MTASTATQPPLRASTSVGAALLSAGLAGGITLAAFLLRASGGWVAVVGMLLIVWGLWGGERGAFTVGVIALAIGAVLATHPLSSGSAVVANVILGALLVAVIATADLSFVSRRAEWVSRVTTEGAARAHGVAIAIGVGIAALVVGAISAARWPAWALAIVVGSLSVGALALAVVSQRHRRQWLRDRRG